MIRYSTNTVEFRSKKLNFVIIVKESDKPEMRGNVEVMPDMVNTFIDLRRSSSAAIHLDIKDEAIELKEFLEEFITEWNKQKWNE